MREIRLRFSKTGQAKYISHLDTNRVFSRAISRAKLNIWYTEGFNPHPYMSFSLPLSLGVESLCENMDIRLLDEISDREVMQRMNDALPVGIRVVDVYENFMDCHEIAYSDYVYKIEFDDNDEAMQKIKDILDAPTIMAQKKAKQGRRRVMKETDIKEYIAKYNVSVRDKSVVINARLLAGPDKNLNPVLLFNTIIGLAGLDYQWNSISRIRLLTKDLKEYK